MRRLIVIALLLHVSGLACTGPKETFTLKPDPPEGFFVLKTGTITDSNCRYDTKTTSTFQAEMEMELLGEVKNRQSDGSYEQTYRITRYKIKQVIDGNVLFEGDTKTGSFSDDKLKKIAETILAGRFGVRFGRDGKVVSSSGFEQFSGEVDALPRDEKYNGMIIGMRDNFQKQFVDGMNDGEDLYPKQPVGVGQSWKFEPRESLTQWGKYRTEGKTRFQALEEDSRGDALAVLRHTVAGKQSASKTVEFDNCKSTTRNGRHETVTTLKFNIDKKYSVESKTETTRTYDMLFEYADPSSGNVTGTAKETMVSWMKVRPAGNEETETESP